MAFEAQCASNADREYLLKQKIIKKKGFVWVSINP